MITGKGRAADGTPLVLLGLSEENVKRLKAGKPVRVPSSRLASLGFEHPVTVIIAWGETEEALLEELDAQRLAEAPAGGRG